MRRAGAAAGPGDVFPTFGQTEGKEKGNLRGSRDPVRPPDTNKAEGNSLHDVDAGRA